MSTITIHTRHASGVGHARKGKGKDALKATSTAGEQSAAESLIDKYYGGKGKDTLTELGEKEGNWSAWQFDDRGSAGVSHTAPEPKPAVKPPAITKTELIAPGELSKSLASSLKAHGKTISEQQLADCYSALEESRSEYQTRAILFGIMLLAKKASLKHGKFKPYLEKLFQNRSALRFSDFDKSYRTIQVYMQLAKRFLWKIETNGFLEEVIESDQTAPQITARQVLDLAETGNANEDLFIELQEFVQGRSLRRMLSDFRQAEKDADADRSDEQQSGTSTQNENGQNGESGKDEAPTPPKPLQLMLWESFERDKAPVLERIFSDPGVEDLRGEEAISYYTNIATELESRAKRARNLADAAKEGNSK